MLYAAVCLFESKHRVGKKVYKCSFPYSSLVIATKHFSQPHPFPEGSSEHYSNIFLNQNQIKFSWSLQLNYNMPSLSRSTTGREVVEAFADRVTGKACKHHSAKYF
jgi:hypothetical protein